MPHFITKNIHAYLDYPVAFGLIVMPALLGLGSSSELAVILSVATGVAALILTILTDHKLGLVKILPYKLHLVVDAMVGVVFLAAPFVLGFAGLDAIYYWVIGATVMVVVGAHQEETALA